MTSGPRDPGGGGDTTWTLPTVAAERLEPVPALTVLWHPDPARVGDRCLALPSERQPPCELGRLEPLFHQPGLAGGWPLADPYISRRLLRIEHASGGFRLVPVAGRGAVAIGLGDTRRALESPRVVPREALESGLVLALGVRDVAGSVQPRALLLLHRVLPPDASLTAMGLVGESSQLQEVHRQVRAVGPLDTTVLVRGETGVGKELVARAIHEWSSRRSAPFVAVNMATLDPGTARAELFGHVRGAFTGATTTADGYFREADGGTLFLDEIGAALPQVQKTLLRTLETRTVRPLGARRDVPVDVRLIAATDLDLEAAVETKAFHHALLHRFAAFVIRVPPLRERREDVPRLAVHFARAELTRIGRGGLPSADARSPTPWWPCELTEALLLQRWPGNVRELRNTVTRIVVSSLDRPELEMPPGVFGTSSSPPGSPSLPAPEEPEGSRPSEVTEEELLAALAAHAYAAQPAADALGVSRSSLYRLMRACPRVRKRVDVDRAELVAALEAAGGDVDAAVPALRISARAIKLRMTELGLR